MPEGSRGASCRLWRSPAITSTTEPGSARQRLGTTADQPAIRQAEQAALVLAASVTSAHMAETIISVVTVQAADRLAAIVIALAVVSEALRRPTARTVWSTAGSWRAGSGRGRDRRRLPAPEAAVRQASV
jgi:hypothetical protein